MAFNRDKRQEQEDTLDEHTVFINRCAKTVKGGRRMSFSAVIVVGDFDVDKVEQKIKALFSPIQMPKNPAPVVAEAVPDNAEPIYVIDKDKEMQKAAEAEAAARPARAPRGRKMRRSPAAWELPMPEDEIDLHGIG